MKFRNTQRFAQILFTTICGVLLIIGCDACDDGVTDPPVSRPQYIVSINLHNNAAPEMFIDESVQIAGSLTDREGTKLSSQRIYFTVTPDSVGNVTPPPSIAAITMAGDADGFQEDVIFVARKPGIALITARYYVDNVVRAVDTLHVQSKLHGNE